MIHPREFFSAPGSVVRDEAVKPDQSRHLLVVDDDPSFCDLVAITARRSGFKTTSMTDSRRFKEVYNDDLNIIVLDLQMPHMDGIEIIRYLAQKNSQSALVLVSAFDKAVLRSACELAENMGIHVRGSLQKPCPMKSLRTMLMAHREKRMMFDRGGTNELPSVSELATALNDGAVHPYFQPRVDMATGKVISVEALARWNDPVKGFIPPFVFIKLAEDNGLIDQLTETMFISSLRQCAQWKSQYGIDIKVSVNFSYQSITDPNLADRITDRLHSLGLDPSHLVIELTESAVMNDIAESLYTLNRLRLKGIDISIDDFGTGFSSVQQLYRAPFNELKIDQSFVRSIMSDSGARAIVESTLDLGRRLNMTVVAEGIESREIYTALVEMGCNQGQGYFIGRPMAAAALPDWLAEWTSQRLSPGRTPAGSENSLHM